MNSCILMVQITKDPELRYTADSQLPVAEMIVEFPNLGVNNKPALLKVVAWRDLAEQVNEKYHQGDYVIVEGRLNINTIERPEGFKEKRSELTASKIYPISSEAMTQDENQMPTNKSSNRNFTKQQSQEEQYSNVVDLKSRLSSTVNEESKTDLLESELPADDFDPIPF
ncbi:MAG: single-stranded DNA-binding protein [Trichodesmium sp. St16_bin4-tuft]|nr:single-stranded DNA-binding protein [Trichodesmium sp. St5_bin8]MDE5078229.1 single-stranded DNA-binding protein [Trichodesmium sp. St2_bin6]MDE5100562.1 single-stranded DNA-binding protein [Trichodesmium sp. St16_bin4-tuft]MDE5101454.1 single-stranded DNA-binding protein [Trichodesmium sp. St19_bin2]